MFHRPKHTPRHRWSLRRKLAAISSPILVLAAVVAIAALLLRAPVSGGGNVQAPAGLKFTAIGATLVSGTAEPSASVNNGGSSATINLSNALPGAVVDVQMEVQLTGSQTGAATVADFRFSDATDEAITVGAGAFIPVAPNTRPVTVRITIPAATPSGPFSASADAGLYANFA